jgi:hypothetical protein
LEWVDGAPLSMATGRCLRIPHQARIHPLKYLRGLANRVVQANGRLYANTRVDKVEETNTGVVVTTAAGHQTKAKTAVIATNSPINDRVAIHSKQAPYRTYAFAAEIQSGQSRMRSIGTPLIPIITFACSPEPAERTF